MSFYPRTKFENSSTNFRSLLWLKKLKGAPVAAETPEPAAEPMPEPTVAVPEQSMAQA